MAGGRRSHAYFDFSSSPFFSSSHHSLEFSAVRAAGATRQSCG